MKIQNLDALNKELDEGRVAHGGMVRVPAASWNAEGGGESAAELSRAIQQSIDEGMAALRNHTLKFAADVELPPGAQVQVGDFYDVGTGDYVMFWRVFCRTIERAPGGGS